MKKLARLLFSMPIAIGLMFTSCKKDKANVYEGCCGAAPVEMDFSPGKIYVPNMFTPNYDGINDEFVIWADDGVELIEAFRITDKEGNVLYSFFNFLPNNFAYGWDSSINGDVLHQGLFNYHIKLRNTDGQVFEVDGTACAFVCDEANVFDEFENCTFGTQHNGFGEYEQNLPSLESGCQ